MDELFVEMHRLNNLQKGSILTRVFALAEVYKRKGIAIHPNEIFGIVQDKIKEVEGSGSSNDFGN